MILILSGDVSLNPGPVYNYHTPNLTEWDIFKIKGFQLLHLNVNSLLPKTDELRNIAKLSNAAVIVITGLKLGNCSFDSEIQIDNYQMIPCDNSIIIFLTQKCQIDYYQIIRCNRNRKGGEIACYVRNDLSYIEKDFFPEETENIFFEILLPSKTKHITVGIIYRPPNQNNFLQTLNEDFAKLDTLKNELYILGDFNINLYQNQNYTGCKNNTLVSATVSNDVKNYQYLA